MPSAIFLLMIDARDERDALDRAGHVAQRVELAVGRRDLRRSGRSARSRSSATRRAQLVERQRRCETRESTRACRACRRCGRGRGPTSSARARRTPPPAARGSSDVLSPTPPVLCLSTGDRRRARVVDAHAGAHHRVGQRRGLLGASCRAAGSPSAAPTPGSRARLPSVTPATKNSISSRSSVPPSRLCRMTIDRAHERMWVWTGTGANPAKSRHYYRLWP